MRRQGGHVHRRIPAGTTTSTASTASTAAPTTTGTVARMSEGGWLKAITKVHQTIDKPFTSSINMTCAKMVELENTLRGLCDRQAGVSNVRPGRGMVCPGRSCQ
jgi:hypothetical protein